MSSSKKPTTSNSAVIPALFDGNHAHGRDAEQAVIPNHVVAVRLAAVVFDSVDAGMAAALGDEVWHEVLRRDDLVGVGEWKPKVLQEVVGPAAHAGKVDEADVAPALYLGDLGLVPPNRASQSPASRRALCQRSSSKPSAGR